MSTINQRVVPKIPLGWYFLVVKYGNTTGFELHFVVLPARRHSATFQEALIVHTVWYFGAIYNGIDE
jgi:hypothetical protein